MHPIRPNQNLFHHMVQPDFEAIHESKRVPFARFKLAVERLSAIYRSGEPPLLTPMEFFNLGQQVIYKYFVDMVIRAWPGDEHVFEDEMDPERLKNSQEYRDFLTNVEQVLPKKEGLPSLETALAFDLVLTLDLSTGFISRPKERYSLAQFLIDMKLLCVQRTHRCVRSVYLKPTLPRTFTDHVEPVLRTYFSVDLSELLFRS